MTSRNELDQIRDHADVLATRLDDSKQHSATLEIEITEMKARLATMESGKAPKGAVPPVHSASRVRVIHPESEVLLDLRMPGDNDLLGLLAIVRNDYPSLRPTAASLTNQREDFIGFKVAFRWLFDVGRGSLDLRRTINFLADRAQGFALFHRMKVSINGSQLLAACIAAGDVEFLDPDRYPNNLMHLNLKEGYGGQPANVQAWRRVLATGKAPAASGFRPREYERGGVAIRCTK